MQSGFRKQRGTGDYIVRLQDCVHKALHTGEHTLAVFLDLSKAFDMVWSAGLLYKLRQLGVGGRIHAWIADFLTGRKIRVRVGAAISNSHDLVNGTPQGSIISPLLFNVMINDLPTPTCANMHDSIIADESAAWKAGKNIALLCSDMQQHLDKVVEWSSTWGFTLSKTKSTAVLFTHDTRLEAGVELTIHGAAVPVSKQAKFLGVTYDQRLSWKPHISGVVDRTKSAYNLMRCVSGQSWGASNKALLAIYRALMRSRLDYGSQAFYTASKTQLQRLDQIQSKCLRLSCGAFCSTAVNALQQDCGEMPLHLKRRQLTLRLASKVAVNPTNLARELSSVTEDDWRMHLGKYERGKEPIYTLLED